MKYILDTDILIYFLNGVPEITKKMLEIDIGDLATTIITHNELHYGVHNSAKKKSNLIKVDSLLKQLTILPFTEDASLIFANEKARLKKSGALIADMDLMIASIAINKGLKLATNNKKHFQRLRNLSIETWV